MCCRNKRAKALDYFSGVILFVQDSALVEEEKDVVPQSPAFSQLHDTFTLDTQEGSCSESGLGYNPSDSLEESDTNQNEMEDATLKASTENQRQLSKLACVCFL